MNVISKKPGQSGRASKLGRTPASATDREKSDLDDKAVSEAVTNEHGGTASGDTSVLPGPPIAPKIQAEVRGERQIGKRRASGRRGSPGVRTEGEKAMIDTNDIREHMEVVGSDGEHVGTVDHCEGSNVIKLTKNDPAAGGEHHYIPFAWVDRIDQRVHLAHPGNEARARWG
jgi:hypothetical protein